MENKTGKKKVNEIKRPMDLSQSAVLNPISYLEIQNEDISEYIDDFLFDIPNVTLLSDIRSTKKKKVKKIIKKKLKKPKLNSTNEIKNIESNKKESEKKEIEKQIKSIESNKKESIKNEKIKESKNNETNKKESEKKEKEKEKKNSNKTNNINDNTISTVSNKVINNELFIKTEEKNNKKKEIEKVNKEKKEKKDNKKKQIKQIKKKEIDNETVLYFISYIKKIMILNLKKLLKLTFFYMRIQKNTKNACTKIASIYKGYSVRKIFKLNYLTKRILIYRDLCVSKIIAHYKGYIIRKLAKPILLKKEDNYVIYSTLSNNKMLYFKISFIMGIENNIYFIYCKLLNCFIYYINKRETNLSQSILEGYFWNEKYQKLTDDFYPKNEDGENILNFPNILKKHDNNIDNIDKIINEYMKEHRYAKKKRVNIFESEVRKKKALDDDMLLKNKKFEKLSKTGRSKSFMRLKKIPTKSILKPSKSYINLRTDDKKIQFGMAKIKRYHLLKK